MSMICPNSCPASTGVVLGNDPPHPGFYAVSAKFAKLQFQLRSARTFHPRAVTPQRQPTFHGHAVGQEVKDARPHGIAEGPPDGHGQTQHRLAKAAKRLARSLSLGAMNLDVEGAGQHKTVGVRLPCTPSHDGCNHDEGLQCPANPCPATVLAGGEPFAVSFFPGWPKAASPPGGIYDDDGVFQTLSWSLIVRARWIARARFAR